MGVAHALQAFAHRVGSYKGNKIRMLGIHTGHSNFTGPSQ
jgi:hypothetical protein